MNAFKKAVFAAVAMAGFSTATQATVIGDYITLSGPLLAPKTAVIGSSLEFSAVKDYFNFDFTDFTLTVSLVKSFNETKYTFANSGLFTFTGFDDKITNLTLSPVTPTFTGSLVNNFKYGDNSITLDFSDVTAQNGSSKAVFNITTASDPIAPGANIPEPSSAALLGLGLLGFAASRRKVAKK